MQKKGIAVFDLDGTITSKDTYLEFIKFSKGSVRYYVGLFLLSPFIFLFYLKWLSNDRLKEIFFTYFFKNNSVKQLKDKGQEFCAEVIPKIIFPNAQKVLQYHKEKNHHVMILTASSPLWLKPWSDAKGYELIGTNFHIHKDVFTGKIAGKNCYGQEKQIILQKIIDQYDIEHSYGYGDSKADLHFMSLLKNTYLGSLQDYKKNTES